MCLTALEMAELRQLLIIASRAKHERQRQASCAGKQPYRTFDDAQRTLRHNGHLKAYRCRECNNWHITGSHDHKKRAYDYTRERGIE